jgi:hypothetical protein
MHSLQLLKVGSHRSHRFLRRPFDQIQKKCECRHLRPDRCHYHKMDLPACQHRSDNANRS